MVLAGQLQPVVIAGENSFRRWRPESSIIGIKQKNTPSGSGSVPPGHKETGSRSGIDCQPENESATATAEGGDRGWDRALCVTDVALLPSFRGEDELCPCVLQLCFSFALSVVIG
jgi:hypothetical protein